MNIPGKPFTDTLGELDGGQLHRDLTEAVYNIIAAVMEGSVIIMPRDFQAHKLDPLDRPLTRIKQRATFYDLKSFTDYVTAFKTPSTRLFGLPGPLASDGKAIVQALLDYHTAPEKPAYCTHAATYLPRYSEPWLRWMKAPPMAQATFAEFIEENRKDITQPDAAMLLDIVSKFKASRKQDFDSVAYQPNGDVMVSYSETTQSAGKSGVAVPTELELGIPVFFKGTVYAVPVFMRYRLADGKLTFAVKVDRPDYIEQAAFDEITTAITTATGCPLHLGLLA